MHDSLRPLAGQFDVSTNLFVKALRGIARAELVTRPSDRSNPLIWVAGHLAQARGRMINVLGGRREIPWGQLFSTGSTVGPAEQYPEADSIVHEWTSVSDELTRQLGALDAGALAAPPPMRVSSADGTLRGAVTLFAFHEAYHVGQMGYLRKWLGHSPLVDG